MAKKVSFAKTLVVLDTNQELKVNFQYKKKIRINTRKYDKLKGRKLVRCILHDAKHLKNHIDRNNIIDLSYYYLSKYSDVDVSYEDYIKKIEEYYESALKENTLKNIKKEDFIKKAIEFYVMNNNN